MCNFNMFLFTLRIFTPKNVDFHVSGTKKAKSVFKGQNSIGNEALNYFIITYEA